MVFQIQRMVLARFTSTNIAFRLCNCLFSVKLLTIQTQPHKMNKSILIISIIISFICFLSKSLIAQKETSKQLTPTEIVQMAISQTQAKYCKDTLLLKMLANHYTSVNGHIVHEFEEYFGMYPMGRSYENSYMDFNSRKYHWFYKLVNKTEVVRGIHYSGGMATVVDYFTTNLHANISKQQQISSSFKIKRDFLTDFSNYFYVINDSIKKEGNELLIIDFKPIKPGSKWHGRFYIDNIESVILKCEGTASGEGEDDNTIKEKFTCEYEVKAGVVYPKRGYSSFGSVRNKSALIKSPDIREYEFYSAWLIVDIISINQEKMHLIVDYKDFEDEYDSEKIEIKVAEHFSNNIAFKKQAQHYQNKYKIQKNR